MKREAHERVVVLAAAPQDASLTCKILAKHDIACESCRDVASLCEEIARGAGVIIVGDDTLRGKAAHIVRTELERQPPWSDLPFLVLTRPGAEIDRSLEQMRSLASIAFIERPVRVSSLVSGVRVALQARKRQLQARDVLHFAEADRRKNEFLAMLGHELRNPLAAMRTALMLASTRDASERPLTVHALEVIDRQVTNLSRIVDDLLDVSRIVSGKIVLKKRELDVRQVLEAARAVCDASLRAHGHRLVIDAPPGIWVDADPVRMEQIVVNLLQNAIKYTPDGGHIAVEVRREHGQACLAIRDDGIGLPKAMLSKVFEPFIQADRSLSRSQGGLGLGLPLVKRLIELHGGDIEARSEGENHGSEFVVRLPALEWPRTSHQGETSGAREVAVEGASPRIVRRRVLLVEDNEDIRELLATLLTEWGYHVVAQASNGKQGFEAALLAVPDIALLDLGLPVMDGYDLARKIRATPVLRNAFLVAISGYGQPEDKRLSMDAGFDRHLVKPVEPAELRDTLAEADERPRHSSSGD